MHCWLPWLERRRRSESAFEKYSETSEGPDLVPLSALVVCLSALNFLSSMLREGELRQTAKDKLQKSRLENKIQNYYCEKRTMGSVKQSLILCQSVRQMISYSCSMQESVAHERLFESLGSRSLLSCVWLSRLLSWVKSRLRSRKQNESPYRTSRDEMCCTCRGGRSPVMFSYRNLTSSCVITVMQEGKATELGAVQFRIKTNSKNIRW